jgi:hypothetical protein
MISTGGRYTTGPAVDLPQGGNIFNTTFLPFEGDSQNILIDGYDRMRVYSSTGALLATTEETYAGSNLSIEYQNVPLGLAPVTGDNVPPDRIFIPLRTIPSNLDKDNRFELIVSRNISVSSQFFSNYRDYPQGEIHALYWDGVGMGLQWKTARIKGTVVDYALADADGDGAVDLVVNINTHTGMAGTSKKKTLIMVYPLVVSGASEKIQKTEQ